MRTAFFLLGPGFVGEPLIKSCLEWTVNV